MSPSRSGSWESLCRGQAQLWAGDLARVTCVDRCDEYVSGYCCVFCSYVNVVLSIIGVFHLFFKCLPIKQTYTETLTLDLIMELLY